MLKTKVGNIDLENCLMNASGVYCKDEDELIKLNSLQLLTIT